jgi:NADPH:quinone reductase-like Zn-dependent oxidoreductase
MRPEGGGAMHALRIHEQRGPEGLAHEEAPIPEPGTGDVLVRVHAASFTPTELTWPSTWVDRLGHDRRPVIPGHEVSGTVEALGWGTTGFAVGEAVYGLTDWYRDGSLAEFVAVEARNLAPKPASLDHVQAAALPMPGLTAWQAMFLHGGLSSGQTVLILGAGGGVGSVAVQLARAAGARVLAAGRAGARESVGELGVDRFIDVDRDLFEDVAEEVDLLMDLVGGETLRRSGAMVKEAGIVVSAVEDPRAQLDPARQIRGAYFVVEPDRSELEQLTRRVDVGQLRPVVAEVFDLADGAKAFEAKVGGGIHGKVVLWILADLSWRHPRGMFALIREEVGAMVRLVILWKSKPNDVEVFERHRTDHRRAVQLGRALPATHGRGHACQC